MRHADYEDILYYVRDHLDTARYAYTDAEKVLSLTRAIIRLEQLRVLIATEGIQSGETEGETAEK